MIRNSCDEYMKIFNSLSGKKESLPPPSKKPLRLFVCGPTVYDLSHIGHGRTYIFFDIFVRYLKSLGYKVFYLQNITDVDDKIIARAKEKNMPPLALANELTEKHFRDMKTLGISSVTKYAPATRFIPQIVRQVQTLIRKGYAYEIPNDGYYYDISKFKDYGKLSRRTVEQAEDAVSRIDESVKKRNKGDFCLWKFSRTGEPSWPFDKLRAKLGRPGWHIEDTAITNHYFGPRYELHGGGLDLKFPHHEAEIAQAEAASGKKPLAKIWTHVGMLTVSGQKMSKSLHNFITIQNFLKNHSADVLRLIVAGSLYRSPMDYTESLALDAERTLSGITEFLAKIRHLVNSKIKNQKSKSQIKIQKYEKELNRAMEDDLNTPEALAAIFGLINDVNKVIWNLSKAQAQTAEKWLKSRLQIFGIKLETPKIPSKIKVLVARRELLRSNKQFARSDTLRKKIDELGYRVEDTPRGPLVLKKN